MLRPESCRGLAGRERGLGAVLGGVLCTLEARVGGLDLGLTTTTVGVAQVLHACRGSAQGVSGIVRNLEGAPGAYGKAGLVITRRIGRPLRALKTQHIVKNELDQVWITERKDWRLNERHYGDLIGKTRQEAIEAFGAETVALWASSYDVPPEPMESDGQYYPKGDRRSSTGSLFFDGLGTVRSRSPIGGAEFHGCQV